LNRVVSFVLSRLGMEHWEVVTQWIMWLSSWFLNLMIKNKLSSGKPRKKNSNYGMTLESIITDNHKYIYIELRTLKLDRLLMWETQNSFGAKALWSWSLKALKRLTSQSIIKVGIHSLMR
jgi:hypothetical protein